MAVFIVLWPYLLTTKLKFVIRHNLGRSSVRHGLERFMYPATFKACLSKFKWGFFNGGKSVVFVGQCIAPISGEEIDRVPDTLILCKI